MVSNQVSAFHGSCSRNVAHKFTPADFGWKLVHWSSRHRESLNWPYEPLKIQFAKLGSDQLSAPSSIISCANHGAELTGRLPTPPMGDNSEVPDQDRSTSSSKLGDLPGSEVERDRVSELPNIGRNSTTSRNSIGERASANPRGHPSHEGVANGGGAPQLAKVDLFLDVNRCPTRYVDVASCESVSRTCRSVGH